MRGYFKHFLLALVIAIVFAPWFFTTTPNLGYDLSYDFVPIYGGFPLPWAWMPLVGQGFGMYTLGTSWTYPVQIFFQLLLKLGVPFWFQMKYFAVLPIIIISTIGLVKVSKLYKIDWFVPVLVFLTNTYFLLLIDGGQLNLGLAYSIIPLSFYLFKKAISGNLASKLQFSLSVWVIGAFDMRIVFILALLLGVQFLFEIGKFKSYLWVLVITILSLAFLNVYWILPSTISKVVSLPKGYGSVSQLTKLNFTTITHSLFLQQPHWYKNVFGKITEPVWYFALIPFFAFLSLLNGKKNKNILYFLVIAIAGVVLAKGVNDPFGTVYSWIFEKIPGFNLFRDSSKFFFITAFSYSVLFGFSTDFLKKKWKDSRLGMWAFFIILTLYFIILISPIWTGKMTGTFSKPSYLKDFTSLSKIISLDNNFSRIFWLPTKPGLGYYSHNHPAVDGFSLLERRAFSVGTVGTYEQINFLREAPFMGELFAVSGIKYIAYPYPDERRETLKQDNIDYYFSFLDQLKNLPWIEKSISDPPVAVLQTKKTKDHIFLAENSFYVVGSDRIYWDLMEIPGFDLSNNALIFAEETPGLINNIDPNSKVVLYEKSELDLMMSFVSEDEFYFPADDLGREPADNASGLWKREASDLIWWRDFLQTKYGIDNLDFDYSGGWAISEGSAIYHIPYTIYQSGDSLYARVMKSSRGGRVEFWQGETKVGEIDTLLENSEKVDVKLTGYGDISDKISTYDRAEFEWSRVGKVNSNKSIVIKTFGDINVINTLAIISESKISVLKSKVENLENAETIINWTDLSRNNLELLFESGGESSIKFTKINPTKYKINIEKLDDPSYLIFSETYDGLWELNGQSSKPVYSFLNGFYIDKPGVYTLFFTPQKYVYPGLVISAVSLISILGFLIYSKLRKGN